MSGRKMLTSFVFETCKGQKMTKKLAKDVVDGVLDTIVEGTKSKGALGLTGFGTFKKVSRGPRQVRNPQTGEAMTAPSRSFLRFNASKTLTKDL